MQGEIQRHFGKISLNGYWRLNGKNTDESGNANTGTDTAITYSDANGKFGNGAGFNGTTSKIALTESTPLKPTGAFTIMSWVKPPTVAGNQTIFSNFFSDATKYSGIWLSVQGNNAEIFSANNTGLVQGVNWQWADGLTSLDNGLWHFVVGVWNLFSLYVYVDGKLDSTPVSYTAAPVYNASVAARIGCLNAVGSDTQFMKGTLDEVALYGCAVSAQEIKKYWDSMKQIKI